MSNKLRPTEDDRRAVRDNPEWAEEDFARAQPMRDAFPHLADSLGRRASETRPAKQTVSISLSTDVLDYFRATGPDWQTRIDDALRNVAKAGSKIG